MRRIVLFIILGLVLLVVISSYFIKEGPPPPSAPVPAIAPAPAPEEDKEESIWSQASELEAKNDLLAAREAYQEIISLYPDSGRVIEAFNKIEDLNIQILFSPVVTKDSFLYQVQPGDTLGGIARENNTTVELLKRANGLNSDLIKVGQKLKVAKATYLIVVDKSQYTLKLKSNDQTETVKTYRVSVGPGSLTPNGEFTIINKLVDPPWHVAGAIVPPDSPKNILGSRWLGLSETGYGIHGTIKVETIGQSITQGCIRMTNAEVEELFSIVPVGTKVTIAE